MKARTAALACLLLAGAAPAQEGPLPDGLAGQDQAAPAAEIVSVQPNRPSAGDMVKVLVRPRGGTMLQDLALVLDGKEVRSARNVEGDKAALTFQLPEDASGVLSLRARVGLVQSAPVELFVASVQTPWARMPGGSLGMLGAALVVLFAVSGVISMYGSKTRKAKAAEAEARKALEETRTKTVELEKKLVEVQAQALPNAPAPAPGYAAAEHRALTPAAGVPQVFPEGEVPDPPDDLIRALAAGECVLYAGAGLSAQAGYPTWPKVLAQLLEQMVG
ncbi:MAG TPA: hypothetical protein VND93_34205, partial [Myxococcales bacterium]|nr:hypothetical protein [Myxococcales bacterium]